MIAPEDLVKMRMTQKEKDAQPRVPRAFYHPVCPICNDRKARTTGQRGGRIECSTCRTRREKMEDRTPKEIKALGKQSWDRLVTMVSILASEEAALSMPTFDKAIPCLMNMRQGQGEE